MSDVIVCYQNEGLTKNWSGLESVLRTSRLFILERYSSITALQNLYNVNNESNFSELMF